MADNNKPKQETNNQTNKHVSQFKKKKKSITKLAAHANDTAPCENEYCNKGWKSNMKKKTHCKKKT